MGDLIGTSTLTAEEAKELARLRLVKAVYRNCQLTPMLERRYRLLSARGSAADRFRMGL